MVNWIEILEPESPGSVPLDEVSGSDSGGFNSEISNLKLTRKGSKRISRFGGPRALADFSRIRLPF